MPWDLILFHLEDYLRDFRCAHSAAISEVYTMREFQDCRSAVLHSLGGGHCCEGTAFQAWALIRACVWMSAEEIQCIIPIIKPICGCDQGLIFLQEKIQYRDLLLNRRQPKSKSGRIFVPSEPEFNIVP